jgi:hypothetical protein
MSLHVAAKHLASKGRDGDSTLVHMSPGEVKGLQALAMAHGGSLSINPSTGLAEASFLKRILPMIAGAALTPFLGPMGAALATGGFETVRTGDIGKGLMAGLGAYGGAGLAGSLGSAGASAGLNAATTEAATAGANAGTSALQGAGYEAGIKAGLSPEFIQQSAVDYASNAAGSAAAPFSQATQTMLANPMTTGVQQLTQPGGPSAIYNAMPTGTLPALGTTVASAMTPEAPQMPGMPEEDPRYASAPYRYNLSPNFSGYVPRQPQPYYRPTGLGYAAGGDIMMAAGGSYEDEPMGDDFAMGGSIGGYSDGGRMLKGPGDGMSDSIPGVIGNRQPARLADGEFVVPADVVSHLGNGSTDAGAKKLYSMMDNIRKARTGKKKQAPAVKGDKYLPKFAEGGDVSSTAEASAPAFSYPGSGMSLADIASLGNLIARGDSGLAQAPIQTPMQGFNDTDLADRLAAAQANRPVVEPVKFNLKPYTDTPSSGLSKLFRSFGGASEPEEDSFTDSKGNVYVRRI